MPHKNDRSAVYLAFNSPVAAETREKLKLPRKKITPSRYQQDIFNLLEKFEQNIIVKAVAGAGKTSLLLESIYRMNCDSADARTMHSLGFEMVHNHLGKTRIRLEKQKYRNIAKHFFEKEEMENVKFIDYIRSSAMDEINAENLWQLHNHFGIGSLDDEDGKKIAIIVQKLNQIFAIGMTQAKEGIIDFSDMVYLPVAWRLRYPIYRILLDECQDLTRCQSNFVVNCLMNERTRVLACGDPNQAIFSFAGADADSYPNLKNVLTAIEMPLSVCYRCPTSHLAIAKLIVPEIEEAPGAIYGNVSDIAESDLLETVSPGNLVLSRKTAPLIKLFFRAITQRIPAIVFGRPLGEKLVEDIQRIGRKGKFESFRDNVKKFFDNRISKLDEEEDGTKIEFLLDQKSSILLLHEHFANDTLAEFCTEVDNIFSDKTSKKKVMMSTVHRAKGLENDSVFIIEPQDLPLVWKKQKRWQYQQEQNLRYVSLTRSKQNLYFVKKIKIEREILDEQGTFFDD